MPMDSGLGHDQQFLSLWGLCLVFCSLPWTHSDFWFLTCCEGHECLARSDHPILDLPFSRTVSQTQCLICINCTILMSVTTTEDGLRQAHCCRVVEGRAKAVFGSELNSLFSDVRKEWAWDFKSASLTLVTKHWTNNKPPSLSWRLEFPSYQVRAMPRKWLTFEVLCKIQKRNYFDTKSS